MLTIKKKFRSDPAYSHRDRYPQAAEGCVYLIIRQGGTVGTSYIYTPLSPK